MINALRAQALHPGNDRRGVEAELRDDDYPQADLGGGFELPRQQAFEFQIGDARVAIGIARDADLADAAARDQT